MKQNPCRYCALSYEHNGRHYHSYEPQCSECENIKSHVEYLKSQRKYEMGQPIQRLDVLLQQQFVYLGKSHRPMHIEAVKSFQLRIVLNLLERGGFYMAVKKESEEPNG